MNNPQISIIVPVYNVEKYIRPCLDSILAQTFTDWECILVDDGSQDNSGKICDEYAGKDPRFVVVHKQNEGVAKARITAFEHSKGELITFIDSDDYVSPEYLEKLSKPILEDGADMVSCNFSDVKKGEVKESPQRLVGLFENAGLKDFISNHYFYDASLRREGMTRFLWTKMVKREYVEEGLANGVGLWFGEDQIAVFTILYNIKRLCLIPDRLYYYVHYDEQTTKKYDLSLWRSIITMLEQYSNIDRQGIATKAIRGRTWEYLKVTIYSKMSKANLSCKVFCEHLDFVRNYPYINTFFQHTSADFGIRDNLRYWLLKMKMYNLLYLDVKRSVLKQKLLSR